MIQKILIPVDGSPYSERAAQLGTDMAGKYGASVTLLFVADLHSIQGAPVSSAAKTDMVAALRAVNQEMLEQMAQICRAESITPEIRQVEGTPATTIAQEARDGGYDLIVMGSMGLGLSEIEQQLLGSVTDRVLRQVSCPVLVVR